MTLPEVLKYRNVEGKVYSSDIKLWLGVDIPSKKLWELQDLLTQISQVSKLK